MHLGVRSSFIRNAYLSKNMKENDLIELILNPSEAHLDISTLSSQVQLKIRGKSKNIDR